LSLTDGGLHDRSGLAHEVVSPVIKLAKRTAQSKLNLDRYVVCPVLAAAYSTRSNLIFLSILSSGIGPRNLESTALWRLSPIKKR